MNLLLGTRMSSDTAMEQAGSTAEVYMDKAIRSIDQAFGEGYAKKNPSLFMQVAAADFHTADVGGSPLVEALETISASLERAVDFLTRQEVDA